MSRERPESKLIRKNGANITDLIANGGHVDWFAAKLAGEAFITNAGQFIVLGTTPFHQVSRMLAAVESKLKTTDTPEETLKSFIKILQAKPDLVELAGQLTTEYESYGGTVFQSSSSARGSPSGAGGSSSTEAGGGEYERVFNKCNEIISFLADNVDPEGFAGRLLVQNLIGKDVRDQASVPTLTKPEKIRRLVHAVISRIKLNPANYVKFIGVLKQDSSLGDLIQFIEN